MYKIYFSTVELRSLRNRPELPKAIPLEIETREDALASAFALMENKSVVWRIEDGDGFKMTRADLEIAYEQKTCRWPYT